MINEDKRKLYEDVQKRKERIRLRRERRVKARIRKKAKEARLEGKKTFFSSLADMLAYLPDEEACRNYLEFQRWNGIPKCPHCKVQSKKHYEIKQKGIFKGVRKCFSCRKEFTVRIGTAFEHSQIPLRKWFMCIYMFSSHRKGLSSYQVARDLGITQKSAWFMLGRLRHSNNLKEELFGEQIDGKSMVMVKCDETFVGGKNKNRHRDKKVKNSQGRSYIDKTPVFGLMYRGKVYTEVIPNTQRPTIEPIIKRLVGKGAIIVSDEWSAYEDLEKDYIHIILNHEGKQYGYAGFHGNDIEGFWSILKRGIIGVYHSVSRKHLHLYCNEFEFRYNTRELTNEERFNLSLILDKGKITHKDLVKKNDSANKKQINKRKE